MDGADQITHHATEFVDDAEALRLEDTLWWSVGRRAILKRYLAVACREARLSRILEIGCGSGGNLGLLSEYGDVIAVEQSEVLARRARSRNVAKEVRTGDVLELALPDDVQMTCLFDVLEHIEDDEGFLKKVDRTVGPGHFLLLSVPACQFLYGPHDELLHHYRRYSKRRLDTLLRQNGYAIVQGSYFLFFLFPAVALARLSEKLRAVVGRKRTAVNLGVVPRWANSLLTRVLKLEAALSRIVAFPIGVWYIVLARKMPVGHAS